MILFSVMAAPRHRVSLDEINFDYTSKKTNAIYVCNCFLFKNLLLLTFSLCSFNRQFASTIKRPFAVRYNPYTQSVDVLDNTRCIAYLVSEVKGELCIVSDALRRVQQLEKRILHPKDSIEEEQNGETKATEDVFINNDEAVVVN